MADGLNFVMVRGNLGADPEVRYTQDNKPIASIRIAVGSSWKKDGNRESRTEWIRATIFGQSADFIAKYAKKGAQIELVGGKIVTRKWTDKQGQDKYSTEVQVSYPQGRVDLIDKQQDEGQRHQRSDAGSGGPRQVGHVAQQAVNGGGGEFDDDIPF